jgi:hypothetical protein
MLGSVAFALPEYISDPRVAMKVLYTMIFMYTSIEIGVRTLPTLGRAECIGLAECQDDAGIA